MAMACNHSYNLLSPKLQTSLCNSPIFSYNSLKFPLGSRSDSPIRVSSRTIAPPTAPPATSSFTREDIFQIAQEQRDDSSDLQGFFDRIAYCNRNPEKHSEFIPFVIEDQIIGYVHNDFTNHLRRFVDVFVFINDNSYGSHFGYHVTLHPRLTTPDDRTSAVDYVVKCLGEELFPGIRNERYPVMSSYGTPVFFSLERAAAPYFGIKVYGVHLNGYVEKDGQKYLWIAKRSDLRPTYPGMLDHIAAGGLPHGISCGEHLVKESEEEAGIPSSIANKAIPVGAVSYTDIDGYIYKRDVVFCYDLKLPEGFTPKNQDGETESFKLIPATLAANIVKRGQIFKANCNLSMIDFLVQHGYIKPEDFGYLKLVQSLRSGDCS